MRASKKIWDNLFNVCSGQVTLNDFKALGYLPQEIKEASSCKGRDEEFLHKIFKYKTDYSLEIARFLILECGCDPMATTRWTFIEGVNSPNRSVFLYVLYSRMGHDAMSSCLAMGIRWLPSEDDEIADDLDFHKRCFYSQNFGDILLKPRDYRKDEMSLYLDYGLRITDKTHPHYPLYAHRLGTRAVCVALLSTWKTRCPLARLLGRDVLALVAKMVWSARFLIK